MSADANDQDLGEMDSEEDFSFLPAERKVVTQPIDLSVQTLTEQWNNKTLLLPEIQREYVWDNAKASRLIESLILNIPIPVLYFAETEEAKYEIFDGHQRVRSIVNYLSGIFALSGLAVLREYRGIRFAELPEREQRFLKMRTLRTILISIDSHPNMKFEIYERLNTGSISLNAQELRNSKAHDMAARNPTRIHLVDKLEKLVEEYNLGTLGVEAFFEALKALAATMDKEERRAAREGLSEDEPAVFDLLTKPKPKLSKAEEVAVKKVARELLGKLQDQLAVAEWQTRQQTRAVVQSTIRFTLNELPEKPYPEPLWNEKVDAVWAFIFARRQQHRSETLVRP